MSEVVDGVILRRVVLVFDGTAWFVRRLRQIEHDLSRDEKVYHCDKHLGGPFTLTEGCNFLEQLDLKKTS